MDTATLAFGAILGILMVTAAWLDWSQRRLPNWLAGATLLAGGAATLILHGWSEIGWHAAHSAVALATGLAIYALGWIGAGDAKFYTGVAAWFPLSRAADLLLTVSVFALVLALLWMAALRILHNRQDRRERDARFPVGVPIAIGAMAAFAIPFISPAL